MLRSVPPMVIAGVQGAGKSTIGDLLALSLGAEFIDGDSLHSEQNKEWMASGRALSDAQRLPWLRSVGESLATVAGPGVVVACSALKRSYRDLLREYAPAMFTVFAQGDIALIRTRIEARDHEFMPLSLLKTQFDDLEELQDDEAGLTVDISKRPEQVVEAIIAATRQRGFTHED